MEQIDCRYERNLRKKITRIFFVKRHRTTTVANRLGRCDEKEYGQTVSKKLIEFIRCPIFAVIAQYLGESVGKRDRTFISKLASPFPVQASKPSRPTEGGGSRNSCVSDASCRVLRDSEVLPHLRVP